MYIMRIWQEKKDMTLVRFLVVLLALVALFLLPHMASAQPPQLPCRFHGAVQLDGAPVPDDTVITATVGNDTYTVITPAVYGPSTYAIKIVPPPGMSYDDGTQVTFKIGNYTAQQTGSWELGGNIELDLSASIPPTPTPTPTPTLTPTPSPTPTSTPTPTPTPTVSPTPTPTPTPTISPTPTASPTPTPIPPSPEETTNIWTTITIALCIGVLIICGMFAAYLIWKYRTRPSKAGKEAKGEEAEISTRWQDWLMLKMMSNRLVIKIFSTPIVLKVLMWETKVFMSIISLLKRKKAEGEKTEEQEEQ